MIVGDGDIIFDYRLGYVRAGCTLPGFDVIGEDGALRILILGGYTTTSQSKAGISWVDSIYKIFNKTNIAVQIINGDTDGFTTAQELMMFIRDGILLNPKLVISLSGFYDFAYGLGFVKDREYSNILRNHPFTNPEQLKFYKYITSRIGIGNDKMYYGRQNNAPTWECWLENINVIHCLCEEFGIEYMSFLQPCIFSSGYMRSQREDSYLIEEYSITSIELEELQEKFRLIYKNVATNIKEKDYISDISKLYTGDTDIYIDPCHVNVKYTNKLAEVIYKNIARYISPNGGVDR